jgi:hypothetical protein
MNYLLSNYWAWGLSAFAIGVATALSFHRRAERTAMAGWLAWFALAFVAGVPTSWLDLLPGRGALWLDTGLALFAGFLVGAIIGALIGRRSLREHEGWAIGLVPLALVWLGANLLTGRGLEQDLKRRVATAIEKVGGDPAYLDVSGRDVLLPRDAANRAAVLDELAQIPDIRQVTDVDGLTGGAAKAYENTLVARRAARDSETAAPSSGGGAPPAIVPAPVEPPAAAEPGSQAKPKEPPRVVGRPGAAPERGSAGEPATALSAPPANNRTNGQTAPDKEARAGKPDSSRGEVGKVEPGRADAGKSDVGKSDVGKSDVGKSEAGKTEAGKTETTKGGDDRKSAPAETPAEALASVAPTGELDVAACQKAVAATLAQEPILFARSGGVRRASSGALEKVTGFLKRCPGAEVEVRVRSEGSGREARDLARDRTRRLAGYLERMGVEKRRFVPERQGPVSKDEPPPPGANVVQMTVEPRQ